MNSSSDELLTSHDRLLSLEDNLAKERSGLIKNYNQATSASNASYYPYISMLEKFSGLAHEHTTELAKFKILVQNLLKQRQNVNVGNVVDNNTNNNNINNNSSNNDNNNQNNNAEMVSSYNTMNGNNNPSQREIANNNNNNNAYNNGNINYIDDKQPVPPQQQQQPQQPPQPQQQPVSTQQQQQAAVTPQQENLPPPSSLNVDTLYNDGNDSQSMQPRKPPVKQSKPPLKMMNNMNMAGNVGRMNNMNISSSPQQRSTQSPSQSQSQSQSRPPSNVMIVTKQSAQSSATTMSVQYPTKSRKVIVSRHKYTYGGQGFDVWRRNYMRPMYADTMLYIGLSFGFEGSNNAQQQQQQSPQTKKKRQMNAAEIAERSSKERVFRFLYEKGGFPKGCIEQILFRQNKNNQQFTLVRVRASLSAIHRGIAKINKVYHEKKAKTPKKKSNANNDDDDDKNDDNKQQQVPQQQNEPEIIHEFKKKQRINRKATPNTRLYVNNFDILDKNCHYDLTQIFLSFGALERDLFIGKDAKGNPFAFVEFRSIEHAKRCFNAQNNSYNYYNKNNKNKIYPIYFPQNNYNNKNCRKLNIEYNNSDKRMQNQSNNRKKQKRGKKFYNTRR